MPSIDILGWNVNQGGYDKRHVFDGAPEVPPTPERERQVHDFLTAQHRDGVDTASLIDTYGWRERYGDNEAIARHLGFKAATFVPLADDRIDRVLGPGAGLTFATDRPVEEAGPLDLDNRQGIKSIITSGGRALQVVTLYLDDMDENLRSAQLSAGLAGIEDEPTLLVGDLNTLRPELKGADVPARAHDIGFRAVVFALHILPKQETVETIMTKLSRQALAAKVGYYRRALSGLNRREAVPQLEQRGYRDADPKKQPTFHKLGRLGLSVDYIFHSPEVETDDFRVIPAGDASDHDAVRARAHLAA